MLLLTLFSNNNWPYFTAQIELISPITPSVKNRYEADGTSEVKKILCYQISNS